MAKRSRGRILDTVLVAHPIGLALSVVAFVLILWLSAIALFIIIAGGALILYGLWQLFYTPVALVNDIWFGILMAGSTLAIIGAGVLIIKGGIKFGDCIVTIYGFVAKYVNKHIGHTDKELKTDFAPQPDEMQDVKQRFTITKMAAFILLFGISLYGCAWLSGARGGSIFRNNGRFYIETFNRFSNNMLANIPLEDGYFNEIDIFTTFNNISIRPAASNYLRLYSTNDVSTRVDDDVLFITQVQKGAHAAFHMDISNKNNSEIRLYLPIELYEKKHISLQTSSGHIFIEGVNISRITALSSRGHIEVKDIENMLDSILLSSRRSGSIVIENIHASNMDLRTSRGNIYADNVNWQNLTVRSTSGSIRIYHGYDLGQRFNRQLTTTQINSNTGAVNLELQKPRDNVQVNLYSESGTKLVDSERVRNMNLHIRARGTYTVDIRTSSGSISVNFAG